MTEVEKIIINKKEILLYRDIGTGLYRFSKDAVEILLQAFEEVEQYRATGTIEEFKSLKEKNEKGLIVELSCPIGSTVWFVGNYFVNDYEVRRYIIDETGVDCIQVAKEIDGRDYWNSFSIDSIGKTVFLTKEEAERALADRQGN